MSDVLKCLSLDEEPEVARFVQQARESGAACFLTHNGKPIAILVPLESDARFGPWSAEEREAFLSLAGLLTEEEGEAALQHIREGRELPDHAEVAGS